MGGIAIDRGGGNLGSGSRFRGRRLRHLRHVMTMSMRRCGRSGRRGCGFRNGRGRRRSLRRGNRLRRSRCTPSVCLRGLDRCGLCFSDRLGLSGSRLGFDSNLGSRWLGPARCCRGRCFRRRLLAVSLRYTGVTSQREQKHHTCNTGQPVLQARSIRWRSHSSPPCRMPSVPTDASMLLSDGAPRRHSRSKTYRVSRTAVCAKTTWSVSCATHMNSASRIRPVQYRLAASR